MAGSTAVVYDAHAYEPLSKTNDPHGHGTDCDCRPACKICGSAEDAYIHSEEGADNNATLVVRTAGDEAEAAESGE